MQTAKLGDELFPSNKECSLQADIVLAISSYSKLCFVVCNIVMSEFQEMMYSGLS